MAGPLLIEDRPLKAAEVAAKLGVNSWLASDRLPKNAAHITSPNGRSSPGTDRETLSRVAQNRHTDRHTAGTCLDRALDRSGDWP